jgi:hypothetical protein
MTRNVYCVRQELNFYIKFRLRSLFKGLEPTFPNKSALFSRTVTGRYVEHDPRSGPGEQQLKEVKFLPQGKNYSFYWSQLRNLSFWMIVISNFVISWEASSVDLGVTGVCFLCSLLGDIWIISTVPEVNYFLMESSFAPHCDVSVNARPHIRRWSHNIILL